MFQPIFVQSDAFCLLVIPTAVIQSNKNPQGLQCLHGISVYTSYKLLHRCENTQYYKTWSNFVNNFVDYVAISICKCNKSIIVNCITHHQNFVIIKKKRHRNTLKCNQEKLTYNYHNTILIQPIVFCHTTLSQSNK